MSYILWGTHLLRSYSIVLCHALHFVVFYSDFMCWSLCNKVELMSKISKYSAVLDYWQFTSVLVLEAYDSTSAKGCFLWGWWPILLLRSLCFQSHSGCWGNHESGKWVFSEIYSETIKPAELIMLLLFIKCMIEPSDKKKFLHI